jgi:hypothetical protein
MKEHPTLSEWFESDPCWERVVAVAAIGASLGIGCASIVGFVITLPSGFSAALRAGVGIGLLLGAPLGGLLAPLMWPILRDVSIRRVIVGCTTGTVAGGLLCFAFTLPLRHVIDGIVMIALLVGPIFGLLASSIYLRSNTGRRS